jgi:aerobic-type carbon monoxide dehydrogenase small subunit (CoxS/CutS family)
MSILFTINGLQQSVDASRGGEKLLDYLHDEMNLTGTKLCCGIGVCRACTVKVVKGDSPAAEPVIACSTALATLDNCAITTVEGVAWGGVLHPIQQAFLDHFSFQCGYCTPGFVMTAVTFLDWLAASPVTEEDLDAAIEEAIGTHICRCTGYVRYHQAMRDVALKVIAERGQG